MYLRNCESVWCKDDDDDGDSVALEMLPTLAILQLEIFFKSSTISTSSFCCYAWLSRSRPSSSSIILPL